MGMTKPSLLLLAALVFVTTERDPSVTVIQSVTDEVGGRSRSETRLAISGSCRGQHLGAILLLDALYRSWRNTSRVASIGVIVGALVDNARAVYIHQDFIPLEDHPDKLFIAMAAIEKAFKAR